MPVLFPNDVLEPLRKLVLQRQHCRVLSENIFLFLSTGNSKDHVSGWHAVYKVTESYTEHLEKWLKHKVNINGKYKEARCGIMCILQNLRFKRICGGGSLNEALKEVSGNREQVNTEAIMALTKAIGVSVKILNPIPKENVIKNLPETS